MLHGRDAANEELLFGSCLRCLSRLLMALDALELRDVAEIDWMLERLVGLVAELAFPIGQRSQVNRMNERTHLH